MALPETLVERIQEHAIAYDRALNMALSELDTLSFWIGRAHDHWGADWCELERATRIDGETLERIGALAMGRSLLRHIAEIGYICD
jgi:hypothetical protein